MNQLDLRRLGGPALLLLLLSASLAACGGTTPVDTPVPAPPATTAPVAGATAPAPAPAPALVAPTATTAPAAPAPALAAPTTTMAPAAPATATQASVVPTHTVPAAGSGGTGGAAGAPGRLAQAVKDMKALKSYHEDWVRVAGGQNTTVSLDVDQVNKNYRWHFSTASQSRTMVIVGSNTWTSVDGGKSWTHNSNDPLAAQIVGAYTAPWNLPPQPGAGNPASEQIYGVDTNQYTAGNPASEQVDGVDTNHYVQHTAESGGSYSTDVWITIDANPTIQQVKRTASFGPTITFKWSKFNADLGIKAP